jgi:hypothetical protein
VVGRGSRFTFPLPISAADRRSGESEPAVETESGETAAAAASAEGPLIG